MSNRAVVVTACTPSGGADLARGDNPGHDGRRLSMV